MLNVYFSFFLCHSQVQRFLLPLQREAVYSTALTNDVPILKNLLKDPREARKRTKFPTFAPPRSGSPSFYVNEVLPKLKISKVIGLLVTDGGCLKMSIIIIQWTSLSSYCYALRRNMMVKRNDLTISRIFKIL